MNAREARLYFEIQQTAHVLKQISVARMKEAAGVTPAQAIVLTIVGSKGKVRQNEIARYLDQAEAAVTQMVSRLMEKGLVERERSPDDNRAWQLSLTEQGAWSAARARRAMDEINTVIDQTLAEESVDDVVRALKKIREGIASNWSR